MSQRAAVWCEAVRKGLPNMVSELRGRLPVHRSRRERTSQRRSVLALSKAASVRERAKQGGTTA